MKRFRFRLQRVLKVYELIRDEAKAELLEVQRKIEVNENERLVLERSLDSLSKENLSAASVEMQELYRHRAHARLGLLSDERVELEDHRMSALLRFQESERDVRKLERFRDKQYLQYMEEFRALEQKALDEFGVLRGNNLGDSEVSLG